MDNELLLEHYNSLKTIEKRKDFLRSLVYDAPDEFRHWAEEKLDDIEGEEVEIGKENMIQELVGIFKDRILSIEEDPEKYIRDFDPEYDDYNRERSREMAKKVIEPTLEEDEKNYREQKELQDIGRFGPEKPMIETMDPTKIEERHEKDYFSEAQVISSLVKMADKFDQEGKRELATEVDNTLKSFSSRPKAPLKKLDDDVKKNLVIFVHDADQSTLKSIKGLKELFRRLRYFDLAGSVKDIGLDRIVRDMEKTQGGLCDSKKRLYEMMMGRKPSAQALDDFLGTSSEADDSSALDFFDQQMVIEDPEPEDEEEHEEHGEEVEHEDEEKYEEHEEEELTDEMELELEEFLAGLDEDEDE